jgi:hypothetical protein
VQGAEAFLALAHRRCRGGVGAGPRRGGTPGPCGLEQAGLGQPPGIVGGCPPGPGLGAGGAFLFVQHAPCLFILCGLPGGPGRFEANGDLGGCADQGGQLRYPLGGVAEGLAERFGVVARWIHDSPSVSAALVVATGCGAGGGRCGGVRAWPGRAGDGGVRAGWPGWLRE